MTEEKNERETTTNSNKELRNKSNPLGRAAAGGLLGATIGYISAEENRQKIVQSVSKDSLKEKGSKLTSKTKSKVDQLKNTGKEKSVHALKGVQASTTNFFSKQKTSNQEEEADSELINEETNHSEGSYENLKEENEQLSNRLMSLEDKMNKLLEMNGVSARYEEEEVNDGNDEEDNEDADNEGSNYDEAEGKKEATQKDHEQQEIAFSDEEESNDDKKADKKQRQNKQDKKDNQKASNQKASDNKDSKKNASKDKTSNKKASSSKKKSQQKKEKADQEETSLTRNDDTSA